MSNAFSYGWHRYQLWQQPLQVVIHPINADGQLVTQQYIEALSHEHFDDVAQFIEQQWRIYQPRQAGSVHIRLAAQVNSQPPLSHSEDQPLLMLLWSLQLRLWSWQQTGLPLADTASHIYLRFRSPREVTTLEHSVGLEKGRIGIVNGYAGVDYQLLNNVIVVHELLHTLGAEDKYDADSLQALFPHGFAQPLQQPLYPQKQAEIMAGVVPLSEQQFRLPEGLWQTLIGPATAHEIGWL